MRHVAIQNPRGRKAERVSPASRVYFLGVALCCLAVLLGALSLPTDAVAQGNTMAQGNTVAQGAGQGIEFPPVVARIDDYEISRAELLAHAEIIRLNALQGGGADPAGSVAFYRQVLQALIGERLMYADLERRGSVASDADVERVLQNLIAQRGGREAFMESLRQRQISEPALRRQLRQNLTIERLLDQDIGTRVRPAEEELRRFYDSNLDRMWKPERHKVRHILKRVAVMASDDAKEKAHAQLLALREQAASGADFADLARDHSEDVDSREQGGELPWIVIVDPEGDPFAEAVSELATVGQLSNIVETPRGLHLIQLQGREAAKLRTFEEAKAEIAGMLTTTRVKQEVLAKVEALRAKAKIEILI